MNNTYALMVVLSYQRRECSYETPPTLISIDKDISLIYDLSVNNFKIPEENITIVSDINLSEDEKYKEANYIHIHDPDVECVISEISQFVENTVRDIKKSSENQIQIFLYISCHGHELNLSNSEIHQSLILTADNGKISRYILAKDIFNLLFGKFKISDEGIMKIPIYRKIIDATGKTIYTCTETSINLLPSNTIFPEILIQGRTIYNNRENYETNRGLPHNAKMLSIIDTCYSGHMTHLPYEYSRKKSKMTKIFPREDEKLPLCVSISACKKNKLILYSTDGSPFTKYIYYILNKYKTKFTIQELHNVLYGEIPYLLRKSKPTITSTTKNHNTLVPFLDFKELEIPVIIR